MRQRFVRAFPHIPSSLTVAAMTALLLISTVARGDDFLDQTIPNKWISPLLPEKLPKLEYPVYYKDFERAKLEAFTGRYKLSLLTLAKVKDADPLQSALIKATSLSALGRKDEAIAALADKKIENKPPAAILRARILSQLGKQDEAIALLQQVLQRDKDSVAAHYYLGQIAEAAGKHEIARSAYEFFKPYTDTLYAREFDNPEELTLIGLGLDRWATLSSAYKDNVGLHNLILEKTFGQVYLRVDRDYWPAKVAAAQFHLSRDDAQTAVKLLKQALAINPHDIPALELLGKISLEQFNFDGCEKAISAIRSVDGEAIEAELLETRNLLQQRRPADALRIVQAVLGRQPKNLQAMGLLAAVYALQLKEAEMTSVLKEVEKIDPENAAAYLEVAEQLGAMRQYPRAAKMYSVAIERASWWTAAYNGLGLLYTQSGEEDEAYKVLEQARRLDPFNYATTNYLRLLDDFKTFARKETDHFVIMYDAKTDPVIPQYFADYLESIYKDVTKEFRTEPPVKTYIEVFPTHDAFSVRTTGSPWIGTVGASTGRVIAMVAPRKGKHTMGAYNWAQVLRHEFTHTVTLAATDNRIAHWMTEGLAVVEERVPLRWEWVPMLFDAVKNKKLFTMENITWGFVRPRKPADRQLAYAQSYWICLYIEETFGHAKMLAMLDEFKKGKEQKEVFPQILGKSLSQFQEDFTEWTQKQVAGWGYDEATTKKYEELVEEGEGLIKSRQYAKAVEVWENIIKLRPMDALPHQRLAGLYLTKDINKPEKAIEHLIRLHKVELHDNRWAKRIARLYRDTNKLDQAVQYGVQSVYVDPYDADAHELLRDLYEKAANEQGAAREREAIKVLESMGAGDKKG